MRTMSSGSSDSRVHPIVGSIRSLGIAPRTQLGAPVKVVQPFVTISRQAGAGGLTLAQRLVEQLNRTDPGEQPWQAWDKELAQRVAEEHHINQTLVETLEDRGPNWLMELLGGLSEGDAGAATSELRVFWKTAATIRAIAQVGRCVVVGRGGVFVTRGLPGGVHIRLVAPLDYRIRNYASTYGVSVTEAEARVHELDHNRQAFYRRHWPNRPLVPESFTAGFNTAVIGERELVQAITCLIVRPQGALREHGVMAM